MRNHCRIALVGDYEPLLLTKRFPWRSVTEAVSHLSPDQVTADLNSVADYAKQLPASNGNIQISLGPSGGTTNLGGFAKWELCCGQNSH